MNVRVNYFDCFQRWNGMVLLVFIFFISGCGGVNVLHYCTGIKCTTLRNTIKGFDVPMTTTPTILTKTIYSTNTTKEKPCHDVTNATILLDFTCTYIWRDTVHHRLIDCFLPNFDILDLAMHLNSKRTPYHVLIPATQREMVGLFLKNNSDLVTTIPQKQHCIQISMTTEVAYMVNTTSNSEVVNSALDQKESQHHKDLLEKLRGKLFGILNITPERKHFVFVERDPKHTRAFRPEVKDFLMTRLTQYPWVTYKGDISFEETVKMFSTAAVVFAFHGAGLTNTFFGPPKGLVVEFTFYMDRNGTQLWRDIVRNKMMSFMPHPVTWISHGLDLGVLGLAEAYDMELEMESRWLKERTLFNVPKWDLNNVALSVSEVLRMLGP